MENEFNKFMDLHFSIDRRKYKLESRNLPPKVRERRIKELVKDEAKLLRMGSQLKALGHTIKVQKDTGGEYEILN